MATGCCGGGRCYCSVVAGDNTTVTGNGAANDPFTVSVGDPGDVPGSFSRTSTSTTIAADGGVVIDAATTSVHYLNFTVDGADATSVTISNGATDLQLRIGIIGTGENVINWTAGTAIAFDPDQGEPQPISTVTQHVDLVYKNATWTEVARSHLRTNQTTANRVTTGQETYPRETTQTTTAMTSGVLRITYFTAYKSQTITSLKTATGATAAGATPSTCKMGLYSVAANGDLTRIGITANDTALWAGTQTAYTKALTGSVQVIAGKRYAFAALCVTGAAAPTLYARTIGQAVGNSNNRLMGALAAQTDIVASITAATVTDAGVQVYGELVP